MFQATNSCIVWEIRSSDTLAIRNSHCGAVANGALVAYPLWEVICPITSRQIESFSLANGTGLSGATLAMNILSDKD